MKIKGSTVQRFLPIFLRFKTPSGSISNTSVTTFYNILDAYAQLCFQKKTGKISVSDLVSRAGYSRTTFYSYFTDVKDVHNTMEDMISFHTHVNSEVYYNCFLGKLSESEEREVLAAIEDFSPMINALMIRSPEYENRYVRDFNAAFEKVLFIKGVPNDIHPALLNALSTSMVSLLKGYFNDESAFSLEMAMYCTKIIVQSIVNSRQ